MNIAYLSTFFPFRGGIAQFNAALYRALEPGHNIRAFTFTRQYPDALFPGRTQYVEKGDNVDEINSVAVLDTVNPISFYNASRKIRRFDPDMMLTKYWMPFFGPSLGYVAKKTKSTGDCINISILDNVIPHEQRPGDINFSKYFLNQNHGFVVMSEKVKEDLLSLRPDAKYIMHEHPLYNHFGEKIDRTLACKRLEIDPDRKILLFFGFIRSYKGLDLLLEALAEMPDEYLLVVAGEVYGDFKKYERIIKEKDLSTKVNLNIRYIADEEVPLFFSASDVCVLPYKSATQSGIVSIAYQFDLPVVATDVGGLKEMIEPHETGEMVASADANSLREGIYSYFEGNKKEKFEENIRKYKDKFSWNSLASAIMNFYEELADEHGLAKDPYEKKSLF